MEKIPLHNLLESVLGIGKINSPEQMAELIAKLEAYVAEHPDASPAEVKAAVKEGKLK